MSVAADKAKKMLEDVGGLREEWLAAARAQHPTMTEDQLAAAWEQVAQQFGL